MNQPFVDPRYMSFALPAPEMAESRYKQYLAEEQRGLKLRGL